MLEFKLTICCDEIKIARLCEKDYILVANDDFCNIMLLLISGNYNFMAYVLQYNIQYCPILYMNVFNQQKGNYEKLT